MALPPEVIQAMSTPMHLILEPSPPHAADISGALYLGSLTAFYDLDLLRQHRISHVVQVIELAWLQKSEGDGLSCYHIDLNDYFTTDLRPHLDAVCTHIDEVLKAGNNVLVHCQEGVSRSASVVIAYLIRNKGMSFSDAYDFVKRKRACIKPNRGFVKALRDWESSSSLVCQA